jgi:Cu-Zn family superoxide dismutase
MMRKRTIVGGASALLLIAGCQQTDRHVGQPLGEVGPSATAVVHDAQGTDVGRATAQAVQGGIRVTLEVHGLPPGEHGAHVHTVGKCDPPDFASAGGHWNPLGAHHGTLNPAGPHMGDLPNLIVGSDGRATMAANITGATMAGLLDADGSAIVVHADPDDMTSDPSGNSGARIACGVFAAS